MSNTRNRTPDTLGEYLGCWIDESGKTQEEIAKAVGYDKPIVITLMRLGQVKVPINKIRPLAEVLGCVDPGHFLRLALIEYMPDTWKAILELTPTRVLTKNELALIDLLRETTNNTDPVMVVENQLMLTVVMA